MAAYTAPAFGQAICKAVGIDPDTVFKAVVISEVGKIDSVTLSIYAGDNIQSIIKEFDMIPKEDTDVQSPR